MMQEYEQKLSLKDASSFLANAGNFGLVLRASSNDCSGPWIIDSGTYNHMTHQSNHFSSHSTKSSKH